ncbi:MAG: chitobiase/beta-hexosaminidase C-terminal domain-containing protein [Phycisphaerae bacterium]|nr:chitobiase/beta-hexosaminidase C-terminal domain-containing protein [Phycisphaerae bacterium]
MTDPQRQRLTLCLLAACLAATAVKGAGAEEPPSQDPRIAQVLARLVPLPDDVARTIMNPYYADPAWKLWAVDPSPVTLDKPSVKGTFQPPPAVLRRYPIILKKGSDDVTLEPLGRSLVSGFWDDCYMSLDAHHTRLSSPRDQFIDGGAMKTARDVQTLLELGVNFTSQSYADRGRAMVDDVFNNLNTERYFFFANCIRATPSHASYSDGDEDKVTDLYDGLFAHSYHSLGQSGSEVHAIYKMMVAGACMPRTTKDLLKKHGAYAIALLTIFKAALPYADARGQTLPYEHELRHRPVYSSNGTPSHAHYCPANVVYHGYNEALHLQTMMGMASSLVVAPPVAVARLLSFQVKQGAETVTDQVRLARHVKCLSLTQIRIWGEPGETLEARINLNKSYDLQHKTLSFKCQTLYPNQKNVSIVQEAPGIYLIRVTHDPKLPKGRIPVICTAYNGEAVPSNPVFINFYWPGENEADDYAAMRELPEDVRARINALGLKHLPVTVNLRPIVDLGVPGDGDAVRCLPGQTVSMDLTARDPEGFPVTILRRAGEIGVIEQGRFTATIPSTDQDKIYQVHLIFSDGTGGYTGKQIKLLVTKEEDRLPKDWAVTAVGNVQRAVTVRCAGDTFTFGTQPVERQVNQKQGTFVFQPISKAADLMCRIPGIRAGHDIALMITNTLDDISRRAGVGLSEGKIAGLIKPSEQTWGEFTYQQEEKRSNDPVYFRLIWRDATVAAYMSTDTKVWEQVLTGKIKFFRECYAGLLYRGNPWTTGDCQWLLPSGLGLPMLSPGTKTPDKAGFYTGPLAVTIACPDQGMTLYYTLDGSEPTVQSQVYQDPIKLDQAGQQEVRVKVLQDGVLSQDTVVAAFKIKS